MSKDDKAAGAPAEKAWDQASDPRPPSQVEAEAAVRGPQPDEGAAKKAADGEDKAE